MSDKSESRPWRSYVEATGAAVALMVVLLPVAGVLIRWIAFATGDLPASAFQVAYSAPIGQLVATALLSLRLTAIYLVGYFGFVEILRLRNVVLQRRLIHGGLVRVSRPSRRIHATRTSLWTQVIRIGLILAAIVLVLMGAFLIRELFIAPSWPYLILTALGVAAILLLARILVKGVERPGLRSVWPVVVLGLMVSAVAYGIAAAIPGLPVGEYSFESSLAGIVSDGTYQELGEGQGDLYLARCTDGRVIRVQETFVKAVVFKRDAKPADYQSLLDLIRGRNKPAVGFQRGC